MILFYDTETTGLTNFKLPPEGPTQPRIVQLGAILTDYDENVIAQVNVIVKPVGFTVPERAAEVHGITTERALAEGIPLSDALAAFAVLLGHADRLVGHNHAYDLFVMRGEYIRSNQPEVAVKMAAMPQFCTMQATTNVCKLPGRYPGQFKWPKLTEAYAHLFKESFDGAHDAMADITATKRIYFSLAKNKAAV